MPLFGWMKWSQEAGVQAQDEAAPLNTPGAVPSRMLIRELLWHVEERERLARELEREHRLAHSALGFHWFQKYPRLRTLIPTSELHQLECLCAQIPPVHTATVLSRFREVLATNNILPWELVYVFKQVLRDFLNKEDCEEEEELSVQPAQLQPMETWTNRYHIRQSFVTPTVPNCGEQQREEIPTISGYVDRAMRRSSSFTAHRDCDLPDYYEVSLRPSGAYSTTL
ncbi:protein RD3-like [Myripristis murdjan]|uniref:protein RD3-like n=1 Tax=Myripristis murdjan TaxID=586833 RepID=UPI001175F945|nr:protein RD3-like [Myripristis murdjan]XP_029900948.1 protein RD3-like [Myripristis murdjan]